MKIEYVVMESDPRGNFSLFEGLKVKNSFLDNCDAENAIVEFFKTTPKDLLGSSFSLFVLKIYKND